MNESLSPSPTIDLSTITITKERSKKGKRGRTGKPHIRNKKTKLPSNLSPPQNHTTKAHGGGRRGLRKSASDLSLRSNTNDVHDNFGMHPVPPNHRTLRQPETEEFSKSYRSHSLSPPPNRKPPELPSNVPQKKGGALVIKPSNSKRTRTPFMELLRHYQIQEKEADSAGEVNYGSVGQKYKTIGPIHRSKRATILKANPHTFAIFFHPFSFFLFIYFAPLLMIIFFFLGYGKETRKVWKEDGTKGSFTSSQATSWEKNAIFSSSKNAIVSPTNCWKKSEP